MVDTKKFLPDKPDVRGCQCESCSFDSLEIPVENEAQKPLNHYKTNVYKSDERS